MSIFLITVCLTVEHGVPEMTFSSFWKHVLLIYCNNFLGTGELVTVFSVTVVSLMHVGSEGQTRHSVPTDELRKLKRLKKLKFVLTLRGQNTK